MKKNQQLQEALPPNIALERTNPREHTPLESPDVSLELKDERPSEEDYSVYESRPKYPLRRPTIFDKSSII